ncbi:MAG: hypothetical protein HY695_12595 [Deltaproteobacteria bacterium]|nr:hypothetical protein [Deltaproteobacteria bacterium]
MKTSTLRHKHLRLDQTKLDRLRSALGSRSETEAIERAIDFLLAEEEIKKLLREIKGKGRIRRVFANGKGHH